MNGLLAPDSLEGKKNPLPLDMYLGESLHSKAHWFPAVWLLACHFTPLNYIFTCQMEIVTENVMRLL